MDRYTLNARVYPMLLFYFPGIFLGVLFSFHFDKEIHILASIGVMGALTYFTSQLGRNAGKRLERRLWEQWGGTPTCQMLRWRDSTIDRNTKARYHAKLQRLCPGHQLPTEAFESANQAQADEIYESWVRFLISKTRDYKKYHLMFKENMSYGFWRNLWGLKKTAVGLIAALMVGTYFCYAVSIGFFTPLKFPITFLIAEIGLLVMLLVWVVVVTTNAIRIPARGYAERLLAATDSIK